MKTDRYTMTPEQIAEKFNYQASAVYNIIKNGFWENKQIYLKDDQDNILINPAMFERWYNKMMQTIQQIEQDKHRKKMFKIVSMGIWAIIFGFMCSLGIGKGNLGPAMVGGIILASMATTFVYVIGRALMFGEPSGQVDNNDFDYNSEGQDQEFLDKLMFPDYAGDIRFSSLTCNIHHQDD